ALSQDPGGDEMQDRLLAADHQRVAGVVPALEAHHTLGVVGEPVDDLALALVAPLGADDDYVLTHAYRCLTTHLPPRLASSLSHPGATGSDACPGRRTTTTSPAWRSLRIAAASAGSLESGARTAAAPFCTGAARTRSRRSMLNPVAGRARPNALPTSS